MRLPIVAAVIVSLPLVAGCSAKPAGSDSGVSDAGSDAGTDAGMDAGVVGCAGPCPVSDVKYLVVIVQENHTFDNHFGRYCTAAAGSNPTCNTGPACCEAGPATDPTDAGPTVLDDAANAAWDPNHMILCETQEIDDGGMDKFVTGALCSNAQNFAYAGQTTVQPYWTLAAQGAIADRYFQSVIGASSSNDIYLARAAWEFDDDIYGPMNAIGDACNTYIQYANYTDTTIGDALAQHSVPWTFFAAGYDAMKAVADAGTCPPIPAGCPANTNVYPCTYDPGDDPFLYFPTLEDKPQYMQDLTAFTNGLSAGTLPAVSFIKGLGYQTEHPGNGDTLSGGVGFATGVVNQILASRYAASTLILITWDESGGYFDHIPPPPASTVDGKSYGMRLPFLAIGPFVKTNYVSHVAMEHASIVRFIEWNWLGGTGQLGTRDATANNLGDLLDPAKTGATVPVH